MTEPPDEASRPAGTTPAEPAPIASVATQRTVDSTDCAASDAERPTADRPRLRIVDTPPPGPWKMPRDRSDRLGFRRRLRDRRRDSDELNAIMRRLYPHRFTPRPPSTFGLTERELITEANRLYALGWSLWEIRQVLDVPMPDRAS